jgi:hypothetical protein
MNFFIVLAVILVFVIFFIWSQNNSQTTYQFRTRKAGHGMAFGTLVNSGEEKVVTEKETINKVQCPIKDGKKGFWVCNELIYPDGRKRSGCGCFYNLEYNDPLNLFNKDNQN